MKKGQVRARARSRSAIILALVAGASGSALLLQQSEPAARLVRAQATAPFAESTVALADFQWPEAQTPEPFSLGRGQTLGQLFRGLGLDGGEAHGAITALASELDPRRTRAGQAGLAYYDPSGEIQRLRFELHRRGWLTLERSDDDWSTSLEEFELTTRQKSIGGTLQTYLFNDVEKAGGAAAVAVEMSNVLRWDLDFNRDLRKGDSFQVLYEENLLDGRYDGVGKILALVYENRGVRHEAFLFGDEGAEGYYDGEGRPLQKMFLKSPLPFMRVTSRFSHNRFHPVLKRNRPHYGVDLGAPRGTPVRTTASGSVTFVGRQGGAGNMVKVRHPNGYETLYLHLHGFAKGLRRGSKVRQGDLIGYVGSTGLSTGPHLDYRVKKNKKYLNPLKLENRPAEPISRNRMAAFHELRDRQRLAMVQGFEPAGPESKNPVKTAALAK